MKKLLEVFKNNDGPTKADWIFYGIMVFVLLVNFAYVDILVTSTHGVNMIDSIFKDGFLNFYNITNGMVIRGMEASAAYDLPIYFVFAIWNFPLWIIKELTNIILVDNGYAIIWMKLLPLLFCFGCAFLVKKICEEIKIDKKWIKWIVFIFLSCPLISTSVILIGQYDVIALFFILLGVRSFIKKDRLNFIIWFAVAIPIKMFALFIFIPLLLIIEKDVIKIIINTASGCFLLILFKTIQCLMPSYLMITSGFNGSMLGRILGGNGIELYFGTPPFYVMIFVTICIICYMKNIKKDQELYKWAIYVPFVVYSTLMIYIFSYPYWIVYSIPFMIIMFFQNTKHLKTNMLLELIYCIVIIIIQIRFYPWCYNTFMMQGSIIPTVFKIFSSGNTALSQFLPDGITPSLLAIWIVINGAMIIINYPKEKSEDDSIEIDKSIIWIRIATPLLIGILLIALYISDSLR